MEKEALIIGKVVDQNKKPISDVNIILKNRNTLVTEKTDSFGEFKASIDGGLIFFKLEKKGFASSGDIIKLENGDIKTLDFNIKQLFSPISGTITNGTLPLDGAKITVLNLENDIILEDISNFDGTFSLMSVPAFKSIKLQIEKKGYLDTSSDYIMLNKNGIKNLNFILNKNRLDLLLEFVNKNGTPLKSEIILINGIEHCTDINGFIKLDFPVFKSLYFNLLIEIKRLNFKYVKKIKRSSALKKRFYITID